MTIISINDGFQMGFNLILIAYEFGWSNVVIWWMAYDKESSLISNGYKVQKKTKRWRTGGAEQWNK